MHKPEIEEVCLHHQEISESQVEIQTHLFWMKKAVWIIILITSTCLGTLGTIAYSVVGLGHSLVIQAQANRDAIVFHSKDIERLREDTRDVCKRIDRLEWKSKSGEER